MSQWQEIVESGNDGQPRYGIGFAAEDPHELLIEDRKRHALIARAGTLAEPLVKELVTQANAAPDMAAQLLEGEKLAAKYQSLSDECKSKADGLVFAQDWMRLRTKAEVYAIVARELLALLTEPTK